MDIRFGWYGMSKRVETDFLNHDKQMHALKGYQGRILTRNR